MTICPSSAVRLVQTSHAGSCFNIFPVTLTKQGSFWGYLAVTLFDPPSLPCMGHVPRGHSVTEVGNRSV